MNEIDVLVVDAAARQRGKLAFVLRAAGYRVGVADTFESAREYLSRGELKCLVAGVRLGPYNGLHLIARAHQLHASVASVLTHDVADPVLKREAQAYGSAFLVLPCAEHVMVSVIRQSIISAAKSSELGIRQRKVGAGEEKFIVDHADFGGKHC